MESKQNIVGDMIAIPHVQKYITNGVGNFIDGNDNPCRIAFCEKMHNQAIFHGMPLNFTDSIDEYLDEDDNTDNNMDLYDDDNTGNNMELVD